MATLRGGSTAPPAPRASGPFDERGARIANTMRAKSVLGCDGRHTSAKVPLVLLGAGSDYQRPNGEGQAGPQRVGKGVEDFDLAADE